VPTAELPGLIAEYAARMHRAASGHHILSPIGAWLLLALVGPGAEGRRREELEAVLGTDVDSAAGYARALLDHPHPAVSAATAQWHRPAVSTPSFDAWTRSLPGATERGDIPSQSEVDEWARRVTQGLIPTFPLELTPETVLLLATALATRISWSRPFELADADELDQAWGPEVHQVLRSTKPHRVSVADTAAAGRVGVHNAGSSSGLTVVSVVADPSAAPAAVIAAAHEVALGDAHEVSLSDLTLGAGHAWNVTEREATASTQDERRSALLPAWHASTRLELRDKPGLGFDTAAEALIALLPPAGYEAEAVQSAVASYTREGFEAAAITAFGVLTSARAFRPVVRDLELRFTRPYAVVAVTRGQLQGPWFGLPVFSGWIERADDAT
jgi:hypothetical protein